MKQDLKDGAWYLVRYELLTGSDATAPAMYKHDARAFYSYLFSGIPVHQATVLREIDCSITHADQAGPQTEPTASQSRWWIDVV